MSKNPMGLLPWAAGLTMAATLAALVCSGGARAQTQRPDPGEEWRLNAWCLEEADAVELSGIMATEGIEGYRRYVYREDDNTCIDLRGNETYRVYGTTVEELWSVQAHDGPYITFWLVEAAGGALMYTWFLDSSGRGA